MRLSATFLLVCGTLAANPEPAPPSSPEPAGAPASGIPHPATPAHERPTSATSLSAEKPVIPAAAASPATDRGHPASATGGNAENIESAAVKPAVPEAHAAAEVVSTEGTTMAAVKEPQPLHNGHRATSSEITSLLRIGHDKQEKGDYATAEMSYLQVLVEQATAEQDREALLGLARTFRKSGSFTKAGATYERFVKDNPGDPELPIIFLELGRTLRALGAHQQAITRFYNVLNTTLKIPDQGPERYRQLVRTAQYEIAETYFQMGDYVQANRYFSRLKLLDFAPEDRALAHFKSALALALAGEDEKVVVLLRTYLDLHPADENAPEAQYLLSVSLRKLNRIPESLQATLALLKVESSRAEDDPKRLQYWQRKTGNQLANEFYERGEIENALQIYTNLAQLSSETSWTLSATYQMGLCYERMRHFDRARECYTKIVDRTKGSKADGTSRGDLSDLADMATWRIGQLEWQITTEKQISSIFSPAAPRAPVSRTLTPPVPLSAADHDVYGSASIASHAVR